MLPNIPKPYFACLLGLASIGFSTIGSIHASSGLPQNLPEGLPSGLLLSPFVADRVWVERWGSNDDWANNGVWLTGNQVGEQVDVNFDNSVLINNRNVYREDDYDGTGLALQEILPKPGFPDSPGISVWVGTAEPEGTSGNDNVDVGGTFTIGSLTVQNVSAGVGRSFRNGGTLVFDSGDAETPARIVHLGDESSDGDDFNIREGTSFQLNSPTEFYLLNTGSRFRIRDNSAITGTGNLILNPGNAPSYNGAETSQGSEIQREVRIEDTGRISTTGEIQIGAARIRIVDNADIISASAIHIHPEGQLRLERTGTVSYDLGDGTIFLDSEGHRMDDESNGAIRQQANTVNDTATVSNPITVVGDSRVHSRDEGNLVLGGDIDGEGELRKTGDGLLRLSGVISNEGGLDITNGTVEILSANRLNSVPLKFGTRENQRKLVLNGNQTVSLLDGEDLDPSDAGTSSTLELELQGSTVLTVDQAFSWDDDEEASTRFQGTISGSGSLVKTGDGTLRLTRWAKTYSGETHIEEGVLEVSASAALAESSGITVLDGGQLRLTTSGSDVQYSFGGPIVLNGDGRSAAVGTGQGLGIRGALRYDPGSGAQQATVASAIELASDAGLHVDGAQKIMRLTGVISGSGGFVKSGGGDLILHADNSYAGDTVIENGRLIIQGSHSGSGTVLVLSGAQLGGTGSIAGDLEIGGDFSIPLGSSTFSVGGSMVLESSARLAFDLDEQSSETARLSSGGSVTIDSGADLELHGSMNAGSYTILSSASGIQGIENLSVSGLAGSGLAANLSVSNDDLVLELYSEDGSDFPIFNFVGPVTPGSQPDTFISEWFGEIRVLNISDDGTTALFEQAKLGALWTHSALVSETGTWFYSAESRSFTFTGENTFPYVYRPAIGWVWYAASDTNYRWLFNLEDESWYAETRTELILVSPAQD
ncbi:MAG: autotransporter-associated beta strand repeat-containing protein [Opitutales bacterium]|nr:autotransporter-associated beta strand repeat-containing protein [Opitutales bacterium]